METTQDHQDYYPDLLPEDRINDLGHVLIAGHASKGDTGYNEKIDVLSIGEEGERAQIYQMWAIDRFASNPVAFDALKEYGLAGSDPTEKEKWAGKEKWTQLLEHISGTAAIGTHIVGMLEKYGAEGEDMGSLYEDVLTATLLHDIEKPAELAAGAKMANDTNASGLENSRDNPVIRAGRLWKYLAAQDVEDRVLLAAQNTGRSDRFFSDLEDYEGSGVGKAIQDREKLAQLLGVDRQVVDTMEPNERRFASIQAKGLAAAIVGISDALAAQFRFRGMSDESIDGMVQHYLSYKKDPESVSFFGKDWPEYYKEVKQFMISQVPERHRAAFAEALDNLTEQQIFNETVLPTVLGEHSMRVAGASETSAYSSLRYPTEQ